MNDDVKKALEELTQTFAIVHRVATHQTDDAYMSIPADPKRDADLRHAAAVEALRAHIDAEPERLAAAVTEAADRAFDAGCKATELEQAHVRLRAVASAREEQREADARAIEPSYSEACTRETDERSEEAAGEALSQARNFLAKVKL